MKVLKVMTMLVLISLTLGACVPPTPVTPTPPPSINKYAVLITGRCCLADCCLNDFSDLYRALIPKYGFTDVNIYVLFTDGSPYDLDGDGGNDIDYSATKNNLLTVFNELKKKVGVKDCLFVYGFNHGGRDNVREARLWLYDTYIDDDEFASEVNEIKAGDKIFLFNCCHGGGFMDELQKSNTVITTACNWYEYAYIADTEGRHGEFSYHWIAAVRGQTPTGVTVDADANKDGFVSMREAFEYARKQDSRPESPQYCENPIGHGNKIALCGKIR